MSEPRARLDARLRAYRVEDEDATIALWRDAWQRTFPEIDFAARVDWWRERWRRELVPANAIVVAEQNGEILGFVTVDAKTLYLDQIVVAHRAWGSGLAQQLLQEAKHLSPAGLDLLVNKDNLRAIRFYEKQGFTFAGEDVNPTSGRPVNRMRWRPA